MRNKDEKQYSGDSPLTKGGGGRKVYQGCNLFVLFSYLDNSHRSLEEINYD